MKRQPYALVQVAVALAVALIVSPVVRTTTIELNNSVGRTWPFSMRHCLTSRTPGCDEGGAGRRPGMTAWSLLRASR